MSEYQYYEFLAIDRPLTTEEMGELRSISTRATITPVSFTNEYNWGDLKADPEKMVARYFDAHVYVANWMSAMFMVRIPLEVLPKETAKAFEVPYQFEFKATDTHWIITWRLEESENYDRFGMEDGRSWMSLLSPVREELLRGDIRSLYIGWLAAMAWEIKEDEPPDDDDMDENRREPMCVSGLGDLNPAQLALAEFLELDPDLLAGAGMGSPAITGNTVSPEKEDAWIDGLPRKYVNAMVKQLFEGDSRRVERTLKNRFAEWRRGLQGDEKEAPRRTFAELMKNAKMAEKKHLEQQKRKREAREQKRRKEREAYLKNLAKDFSKAWKAVQQFAETGSGRSYDEARNLIVDLSEAYALHASQRRFRQDLKNFMTNHMRRKALIRRLEKAGLW